jgi:hypothetical protein
MDPIDPIEFMQWHNNDEEIIASLQATILLLLQRRSAKPKHGGPKFGRKEINRNRLQCHNQLYNHYFSDYPTYPDNIFQCCFRMQKSLFLKIVSAIVKEDHYFAQKRDAAHLLGFSPLQKATVAMRMLAYGYSVDLFDEYL